MQLYKLKYVSTPFKSVKRGYWKREEVDILLKAYQELGTDWTAISQVYFPQKTPEQCEIKYKQYKQLVLPEEKTYQPVNFTEQRPFIRPVIPAEEGSIFFPALPSKGV